MKLLELAITMIYDAKELTTGTVEPVPFTGNSSPFQLPVSENLSLVILVSTTGALPDTLLRRTTA
jgi:hypothetical protein